MGKATIFYSWQSDTTSKFNRYFIEECLKKAIKKTNKEIDVDYNLDRDTKNEVGSPDIVATIFQKIEDACLFIADITPINSDTENQRITPNPNVLIELGYAASHIGWKNIICVFNSAFGRIEELPFDIKSRRISPYYFKDISNKKEAADSLINTFCQVLLKANIDLYKKLPEIKEWYKDESEDIKRIAYKQEGKWEFELLAKLLKIKFQKLEFELENIEKGYLNTPIKELEPEEFLKWQQDAFSELQSIIQNTAAVINEEIFAAIGEPGQPGDAILILKSSTSIYLILQRIIEFEKSLRSLRLSNNLEKVKILMIGWAKEFIIQLKELPKEFEKIYLGNYGVNEEVTIQIKFNPLKNVDELLALSEEFKKNPELMYK